MFAKKLLALGVFVTIFCVSSSLAQAASVTVEGKAKSLNTANSYIDFTNFNSNVVINDATGVFSGYAFSEDLGWFAFGTTDNTSGPVSVDLQSGEVSGKAKSLRTGALLDFTNFSSNVTANISTGVFTGMVFSEDLGWFDFSDTGVTTESTLDVVAPSGFGLLDPADNAYTRSERPSFRWRATTDQIGSISKYRLVVDNGETGDFVIDNIPATGTTNHETSTYVASFEGFSDSDTGNNFITVYTKSSSDWGDASNDGKMKEGKHSWKVEAHDSNGNSASSTFDLFVDFSGPSISLESVNGESIQEGEIQTQDTTPHFYGRVADALRGESEDTRVAAGPSSLEIKIEKLNSLGQYDLHSMVTTRFSDTFWESDGQKILDNTQQQASKYGVFSFTPEALETGVYKVTLLGKDGADNASGQTSFRMTLTRPPIRLPFFSSAPQPEAQENATPVVLMPQKESSLATSEAEIVGESPSEERTQAAWGVWFSRQSETFRQWLLSVRIPSLQLPSMQPPTIPLAWLGGWGDNLADIGQAVGAVPFQVGSTIRDTKGRVELYTKNVVRAGVQSLDDVVARQQELASEFQHWAGYSSSAFQEIVLNKEPTRITDVKIVEIGTDYAIITWQTNHHTMNNKINFGEDTSYGHHVFAPDYEKEHTVRIEGLKPGVKHAFEVMSQGKNYVYDAHYEFETQTEL